jgi:hypothetical protein
LILHSDKQIVNTALVMPWWMLTINPRYPDIVTEIYSQVHLRIRNDSSGF